MSEWITDNCYNTETRHNKCPVFLSSNRQMPPIKPFLYMGLLQSLMWGRNCGLRKPCNLNYHSKSSGAFPQMDLRPFLTHKKGITALVKKKRNESSPTQHEWFTFMPQNRTWSASLCTFPEAQQCNDNRCFHYEFHQRQKATQLPVQGANESAWVVPFYQQVKCQAPSAFYFWMYSHLWQEASGKG